MGPAASYATPGRWVPPNLNATIGSRGPPLDERREDADPAKKLEAIRQIDGPDEFPMASDCEAIRHPCNEIPDRAESLHFVLLAAPIGWK